MATAEQTIVSAKQSLVDKTITPVVLEMMALFPDGLVIASGIYALLTLSYPFAVFFGTMVETTVIFRVLRYMASYLHAVPISTQSVAPASNRCRSGFASPTLSSLSMFGSDPLNNPFPSAPLFMLSTASSYLFNSLNNQSRELQALGPAYSSRYYVSMVFLMILLFIFTAFRILYGCDSFGVLITTILFGLALGTLLLQQNRRLFGEGSVNLIGIPLLRNRAANGKKLYVCPTSGKE